MKHLSIALLCLAVALASCGGRKAKTKVEVPDTPDSTMRVVLDKHTDDSLFVTHIESKGHRRFAYAAALRNGQVMGSIADGDTLAIMPDFKQQAVRSVVNLSQLVGLWLYDEAGNGLRLRPDGAACAVGAQGADVLRSWRVKNGLFILTYVKNDGSDYTERADTSTIVRLDDEHFTFVMAGQEHACHKVDGLITTP